jgi:hypothetical protein
MIRGRVYAFHRKTGQSQWPVPAVIENFSLPLDQPPELPMLTLLRHINSTNPPNATTSILCIDKRDGRILFAKDDIKGHTYAYQFVGNREKNTVSLRLNTVSLRQSNNQTFTIQLSNEPRPPEPPAQTGVAASKRSKGRLSRIAESLFGGTPE